MGAIRSLQQEQKSMMHGKIGQLAQTYTVIEGLDI